MRALSFGRDCPGPCPQRVLGAHGWLLRGSQAEAQLTTKPPAWTTNGANTPGVCALGGRGGAGLRGRMERGRERYGGRRKRVR